MSDNSQLPRDLSGDIDTLLFEYVDRLNAGEILDPEVIEREHPDLAETLIERLEVYRSLGQPAASPLGTLGDYTLRRQIGRGGMGVVYEAWENSIGRPVALKVLPAGIAADRKATARFMREAQAAGQLTHPNVVGVHAMGVYENTPYYSMEFVEGETLAQILARIKDTEPESETSFGPKDQVDYFAKLARACADVADGLQHAHSKGVTHRDIKPSNLILDSEGRLRILDFGLARLEGQESLTISGDLVGTPLYMSPEQARQKKIQIDHRTDVYSLGVTMYEVVCGRPPFKGRDHQDTLSQIIEREPVEPRKISSRVPKDLETILLKCLRKDPKDRYGTAEALAQDLRRFIRGDPIEARPQSEWERLRRRVRRHRGKLFLATAFLTLLVVALWLNQQREEAEFREKVAAYGPAVLEVLKKIHAGQFSLRVVAGETEGLFRLSGSGLSPVRPEDFGLLREARGADRLGQAVSELAEVAGAVDRPDAPYHLARAYKLLGRTKEAQREVERALIHDSAFVPAEILGLELEAHAGDQEPVSIEEFLPRYEESDWQMWWLLAYRSMARKEWSNAVAAYDRLIETSQEPYIGFLPEGYLGRGVAHLEQKNYHLAQQDFAVAHSRAPGFEPVLLLGKALYLGERKELAEKTFTRLYEDAGDRAEAALWIAAVYNAVGDHDKGLEWANTLGEHPLGDRLRAYFHYRIGNTKKAILAGRRAVAREEDLTAHIVLAWALVTEIWSGTTRERRRMLGDLLRVSKRAHDLDRKNASARALLATAEGEIRYDTWRQIMDTLRKSRALAWALPIFLGLSGMTLAQEGSLGRFFPPGDIGEGGRFSGDGLTFYGQERAAGKGYELFLSTRDRKVDERGDPVPWGGRWPLEELNTSYDDASPDVSPDELTIYFLSDRPGGVGGWDIWMAWRSKIVDDEGDRLPFGEPVNLREVNSTSKDRHPMISADGLSLYFVSDRPGGLGGSDIWVATREERVDDSGNRVPFGEPVNLREVNSTGEEIWPSISNGGLILFLSSDRPGGHGSGDIWMAKRERVFDDEGNRLPFGEPVNLGPPVNTALWDLFGTSRDWPVCGSQVGGAHLGGGLFVANWYPSGDCNENGTSDCEEILRGEAADNNADGVPDNCVPFLRGDGNEDGTVDISDAICILDWLFLGDEEPGCVAVTNTNGDAGADLSDPVYLLTHLFLGGPAPVEPFPDCGPGLLATDREMGCATPPENCPQ